VLSRRVRLPQGWIDVGDDGAVGMRCPILIGRDAELGALRAHLADALDGRGGLAIVRGEAGLGKSRLCRELIDGVSGAGKVVTVGRATPTGASAPYRPLAEAVLRAVRARGLPVNEPELAPWLPTLETMVPLPGWKATDQQPRAESPALRGEAMLSLLRWLGSKSGLLVVLEDLHWADPDTLDVVEYLADNLADEPVFCVATLRVGSPSLASELADRLGARGSALLVDLLALDDTAVEAIVRATAPGTTGPDLARIQRFAEGVPFLAEELLGAPGVPRSFTETVRSRLGLLEPSQVDVLVTAALLGRGVDWALLDAASGHPGGLVTEALEAGIGQGLLVNEAAEVRFRHALTRDALTMSVLPARRAELAARALAAVEAAHPGLPGPWAGVAAELAAQSGADARAGELLAIAGDRALEQGALSTAAETLDRAAGLLAKGPEHAAVCSRRVEVLALAGRVDEAMAAGAAAIGELTALGELAQVADVHLHLAQAAVAATRWPVAVEHIASARALLDEEAVPGMRARAAVLEAEARFADGDVAGAVELAEGVVAGADAMAEARCHAWELLGRSVRLGDLARARAAFERGLAIADEAGLGVWRLRALHELATIELLDEAGTGRLLEARRSAEALGALSTAAMLGLQLAAVYHLRFELDEAARYAQDALNLSGRLGLDRVRAMALWFLAENHALRRERGEAERLLALAQAAAPGDAEVDGMVWAGARAMIALLDDDRPGAFDALERGMAILPKHPQSPGHYRGMWPLLLAAEHDPRAVETLAEAHRLGIDVNRINRGLLATAEAILCGRRHDPAATTLMTSARADLARYPVWRELALLVAAEAARDDGWGDPDRWLAEAAEEFTRHGLSALSARCAAGASSPGQRWARLGISPREAEVLGLVADGLANKQIAARLSLSVRTVEKHVESLLRKTGCASRTQLVALVRG
jgi:DNA-binding CsgD family transcriptional regulator/tetratricopeptide (TPR) repeat protein